LKERQMDLAQSKRNAERIGSIMLFMPRLNPAMTTSPSIIIISSYQNAPTREITAPIIFAAPPRHPAV